jgi:Flp pilus assembly protein TadG
VRPRRGEDGAAAVEFALVLPFLILIVAGIVDIGLALVVKAQVHEGAEEAAIHAARYPTQQSAARQHAVDAVSFADLQLSEVTIACDPGDGVGRMVTVTVDHDYELLFGFVVGDLDVGATIKSEVLSDEECP